MPRYYFHLRDGQDTLLDPEGREISDVAMLAPLALKDARSMISQDALAGLVRLDQTIDVLNEAGELVHRLAFRDAVVVIV